MNLTGFPIAKIDSLLRDVLMDALGNEVIRAVMVLAPETLPKGEEVSPPTPDPSSFQSREAYRRAMIAIRQKQVKDSIRKTRQQLDALFLNPRGGTVGYTVVVKGPAHHVLDSLKLPGVQHASLDREIHLIEPRRKKRAGRRREK